MTPELVPIQQSEKEILRSLMTMYFHDMSAFSADDVNADGQYEYPYLDHYWSEKRRHPFFIKVEEKFAGFALVREIDQAEHTVYSMAEFFVMRKYRGRGVAKQAAIKLFNRFKGEWHVAQEAENIAAQGFWRHIIDDYTNGKMRETSGADGHGPFQRFWSRD